MEIYNNNPSLYQVLMILPLMAKFRIISDDNILQDKTVRQAIHFVIQEENEKLKNRTVQNLGVDIKKEMFLITLDQEEECKNIFGYDVLGEITNMFKGITK